MKAFYDSKPSRLEAAGDGSHRYRFNIREAAPGEGGGGPRWSCEEVAVWAPLSPAKVTEAVIADRWGSDREQKAINEYNAALLGIYGEPDGSEARARVEAYRDFLRAREELRRQVDADCAELGIG